MEYDKYGKEIFLEEKVENYMNSLPIKIAF